MNRGEGARWARARAALRSGRRNSRFLITRYRRVSLALAVGVAVAAIVGRVAPVSTVEVIVTTREVSAGEPLANATEIIAAPAHAVTRRAMPPGEVEGARAAHALAAGELVTSADVTDRRIPAGQVAMPIPISTEFRAWLQVGDEIMLYAGHDPTELPPAADEQLLLDGLATDGSDAQTIGPVTVLRTEPGARPMNHGGSETSSVLVLIPRDQAPRLAARSAAGSLSPALMP